MIKKQRLEKILVLIAAFCTMFLCTLTATTTYAKDYSFSWAASPEPVEGYKLYYKKGGEAAIPFDGTAATEGPSPVDIGKKVIFTISGLDDNTTYHFALTAYNGSEESGLSEIITVFPTATPTITNITLKAPSTP